jgi:hypothetical protein
MPRNRQNLLVVVLQWQVASEDVIQEQWIKREWHTPGTLLRKQNV